MAQKDIVAFMAILLTVLSTTNASYINKQLRDALRPQVDQNIQRLNYAIYHAARNNRQHIPYYQGVDVHEYHEIHSLTDVSHNSPDGKGKEDDDQQQRQRKCKGFVCENGGTLKIEAGQCVCSCPSPYVGFNCQFRGDRCKKSDYRDCFLKETHVDLKAGYWAVNFQHHFLAARARYCGICNVTSEELYIGHPYKLTIAYTQKARHQYHRHKMNNELIVLWTPEYKKSKTLLTVNVGQREGINESKCVNIPLGIGEIIIQFSCMNVYTCNIVPSHDTNYIKKKNTAFYIDEVRLEPGDRKSVV